MKTKARKYQKQGIRLIEHRFNGRVLLADEMGLGKTFQSLKVMQRNKRTMLPAVVICPAPLKWNWSDEAAKHIGMAAEVLEGTKPQQQNWRSHNLLIINYEILGPWMEFLQELNPQLIIMDEVHRIKSRSAQCTKHCQELCKGVPNIFALSGTPLTNEPSELFTTLNILWPKEFNSFWTFAQRYTHAEMKRWGWQFKGAKNLPELHERLLNLGMLRRRKVDVLKELPGRTVTVLPQPLSKPKMKEYQKAQNDFINWLSKRSKHKAHKAMKAQRLVKIGYLRRLAAELKLPDVIKWVDNYLEESDEKLLIFGIHRDILGPLFKRYSSRSVLIDGQVTGKQRHTRVLEFRKRADKQIAICNIRAGGVGINMPEATNVLFVELPWTPADLDQAISRAHRMGQTRGVMVHILVAQNTIEERLCQVLQDKQSIADAVLDGGSDEMTRLNIFDQLEMELTRDKPNLTTVS